MTYVRTRTTYKEWFDKQVKIILRTIEKKDIEACIAIVKESYDCITDDIEFELNACFEESWWGLPKYAIIENMETGQIIGMGGYQLSPMDYDCFEIFWITVHQDFRNMGFGNLIVETLEYLIKKEKIFQNDVTILLCCKKGLEKFYKKLGYKKCLDKAAKKEILMGKTFVHKV